MTRALLALIVAGLAAASVVLPEPVAPVTSPVAAVDFPSVSVCPVEEGGGRNTTIAVASNVDGGGQLTVFAGGAVAGSTSFQTGGPGSAAIQAVDVAAVGVAGGLLELPDAEAASGSIFTGAGSVAHETCLATPAPEMLLAGGSTTGDQEHEIQLMNPYSGQAVVDLTVRSESGLESAPQLRGITVPSRSSVVVDMDEILPGRESLAVSIQVASGSALAIGRIVTSGDVALWNAVAPAPDWYVPVPSGGAGEIVISTGVGSDVEYQVDVYGPDGLVEAFAEGVVPAHGDTDISVDVAGEGASAFRVVATQPVAVFLRLVGEEGGIAVTTGSTVTASRWLLPGAGLAEGGTGRLVVLNAGLEQTNVVITALGQQSVVKQPPVDAGSVLEFASIAPSANAYTVSGEGLLVPMWVTSVGTATAYSVGAPLIDE